jgi:poly(3-hydroxybutyrate) depolymerase
VEGAETGTGWTRRTRVAATILALILAGACATAWLYLRTASREQRPTVAPESSGGPVEGALVTRNDAGRTGVFFLPAGYARRPLPLAVLLHGTGGSGEGMLETFRPAATRRSFIVIAPDSGRAPDGMLTWKVADRPGEITPDFEHVGRCVAEVLAKAGVVVDRAHVIVIGHSGGASSAPYVATTAELYESFAVLHGGAFPSGFGPRRPRGWFSTGDRDPLRPPERVRSAAEAVRRAGFADVQMRVFEGDHGIGAIELGQLLDWWLGG